MWMPKCRCARVFFMNKFNGDFFYCFVFLSLNCSDLIPNTDRYTERPGDRASERENLQAQDVIYIFVCIGSAYEIEGTRHIEGKNVDEFNFEKKNKIKFCRLFSFERQANNEWTNNSLTYSQMESFQFVHVSVPPIFMPITRHTFRINRLSL